MNLTKPRAIDLYMYSTTTTVTITLISVFDAQSYASDNEEKEFKINVVFGNLQFIL